MNKQSSHFRSVLMTTVHSFTAGESGIAKRALIPTEISKHKISMPLCLLFLL